MNAIQIINVFSLMIFICFTASARYQWSLPVPIDTSSYPSPIGGAMAIDDGGENVYVTFSSTSEGKFFVAHSTDHGNTWKQYENLGPELARVPRDIVVDHTGSIWLLWISMAAEFAPTYMHLSKSVDSGKTFTTLFTSLSYADGYLHQKLAVDVQNSVYLLWDDSRFKMTKFRFGEIEQRIDAEIPNDTLQVYNYPVLAVSDDYVVHCAWEGVFYDSSTGYNWLVFYSQSNDSGSTFSGRTRVDSSNSVYDHRIINDHPSIALDSSGNIFVGYRWIDSLTKNIRIVRSTNEGKSFKTPIVIADGNADDRCWLSTDSKNGINIIWNTSEGLWHRRSVDGGLSFSPDNFVGRLAMRDLDSDRNGFLFASCVLGMRFYITYTDINLSVKNDPKHPNEFFLLSNYPNPFNPSTQITYSIPKATDVTLKIYNVLGQEIAILVNERKQAGEYKVTWNAEGVPSGVYFYRIVAGDFIETRKMVLIR